MEENRTEEIGFTFDPGIISVLGERKYTTYTEALNEIIRNAIGYKAKKVEIEISQEKITIKDDGIGMNKEDLKNEYFRVGKRTQDPSTGSLFGIGKFATQALAHKTEIITQKEGSKEKFQVFIDWDAAERAKEIESLLSDAYKPMIKKIISSEKEHGTTIILKDLKYKPKDAMEFKNYVEKKLFPILFSGKVEILVNGKKCVAKEPEGEIFEFNSETDFILNEKRILARPAASFGKVWGKFYLTPEPSDDNAIHVYDSYGHRIDSYSERDWLKLSSLTSGMAFRRRVIGIISTTTEEVREVIPCQKCLMLKSDRSGFFEDTQAFKDLVNYLKEIIKLIHEKWLKEYKDISAKIIKTAKEELPKVGEIVKNMLKEEEYVWKREEKGEEREVVRKHKPHEPTKEPPKPPSYKMLQCPQCRAINYISLVNYRVFTENPNPEAKRKMLKNWPCKNCGYYLNPDTDLYKRPSPPKKIGIITTKVKLGIGMSIDLGLQPLGRNGSIAEYDPDSEYLIINSEHAFFIKFGNAGRIALRCYMVLASLYAIAQMKKREEKTDFEPVFNHLCSLAHNWVEKGFSSPNSEEGGK